MDGPDWAEQYLESINAKLDRVDRFLTEQYPNQCKDTEKRLTSLEIRTYIVCAIICGGSYAGSSVISILKGG